MDRTVLLDDGGAKVRYWRDWLPQEERTALEAYLATPEGDAFEQRTFRMFGKEHVMPRRMRAFATAPDQTYTFSRQTLVAEAPMPDAIDALRERVEQRTGQPYNFVLVNKYVDGEQGRAARRQTLWGNRNFTYLSITRHTHSPPPSCALLGKRSGRVGGKKLACILVAASFASERGHPGKRLVDLLLHLVRGIHPGPVLGWQW